MANPRLMKVIGETTEIAMGTTTLSGGSTTVALPHLFKVITGCGAWSNGSVNGTYASASGTTLTITGNGSDAVTYMAWGISKA